MRKYLPLIGVVIVLAFFGYLIMHQMTLNEQRAASNVRPASTPSARTAADAQSITDACAIFNLTDAQKVLGENAIVSPTKPTPAGTDDRVVSQCAYELKAGDAAAYRSAAILVHSAKNAQGAVSNQAQFNAGKSADAQTVNGYGEAAYWSPETGQLSILKHGNWVTLSNGPAGPEQRSLDEARRVADIIVPKL
jgi:hypothetical protein